MHTPGKAVIQPLSHGSRIAVGVIAPYACIMAPLMLYGIVPSAMGLPGFGSEWVFLAWCPVALAGGVALERWTHRQFQPGSDPAGRRTALTLGCILAGPLFFYPPALLWTCMVWMVLAMLAISGSGHPLLGRDAISRWIRRLGRPLLALGLATGLATSCVLAALLVMLVVSQPLEALGLWSPY